MAVSRIRWRFLWVVHVQRSAHELITTPQSSVLSASACLMPATPSVVVLGRGEVGAGGTAFCFKD